MDKSIFEKIADREIPGYIVWEDEKHIAFLTIEPMSEGHTLVVPKKNPGDYVFKLTETDYSELMLASKRVAHKLQETLKPLRVLIAVEGFEVPHVHIHLIPAYETKGIGSLESQKVSDEDLQKVLDKINSVD